MPFSDAKPDRIGRKTFKKDATIFLEGDPGMNAFIVEKGKVEIFKEVNGKKKVLAVLEPYSVFGELALIDNKPRMASARALEDTECTTLDKTYVRDIIESADPSMQVLIKLLMSLIRKQKG